MSAGLKTHGNLQKKRIKDRSPPGGHNRITKRKGHRCKSGGLFECSTNIFIMKTVTSPKVQTANNHYSIICCIINRKL